MSKDQIVTDPALFVDPSRRLLPSSRATVLNSSGNQIHVLKDRYGILREVLPQQTIELEMLNEDIAYFKAQRDPNRLLPIGALGPNPLGGGLVASGGQQMRLHPLIVTPI